MKLLIGLTVVLLALVGVIVGVAAASPPTLSTAPSHGGTAYMPAGVSHAQLESDVAMTQEMSVGNHAGHNCAAGMLQRSSDPAYLRALEQHAADLDRMLARSP